MRKINILITLFALLIFNSSQAGWFDKKIKVTRCYDSSEFNSWRKQVEEYGDKKWEWEIDLEANTATLSFIDNRLRMYKHFIKMKTDKYIIASDNKSPDVQFDLKNELYIGTSPDGEGIRRQCKFS